MIIERVIHLLSPWRQNTSCVLMYPSRPYSNTHLLCMEQVDIEKRNYAMHFNGWSTSCVINVSCKGGGRRIPKQPDDRMKWLKISTIHLFETKIAMQYLWFFGNEATHSRNLSGDNDVYNATCHRPCANINQTPYKFQRKDCLFWNLKPSALRHSTYDHTLD